MTKFLCGHGTSMGGIVVESGRFDWTRTASSRRSPSPTRRTTGSTFHETFGDFGFSMKARAVALRDLGPALSPTNAFHILTGIETLPLRMERHVANARAVAEFLAAIRRSPGCRCAGLPSSAYAASRRSTCRRAPGRCSRSGSRAASRPGVRLVESVDLWSHLANVGDTRSLILHPASTTHRQLTDEQRTAAGAGPDVIRLSVGIETVDDLIADLAQALAAAT